MTDNRSPSLIPHCPNAFEPSVVAVFDGGEENNIDANESLEMTIMPLISLLSRPRMADAKLDKSERVVEGGNDMASVLDDGG